MTLRRVLTSVVLLGVAWLLVPPKAYGYVDAGSGSYLVQLAIGGILGVTVSFKGFWRRVWRRLTASTRLPGLWRRRRLP